MFKAIKQELYRLGHSWPLLLIALAAAVIGMLSSGGDLPIVGSHVKVQEPHYQLQDEFHFVDWIERTNIHFDKIKQSYGLPESRAETATEFFIETNPYAYVRILWYEGSFFLLLCVLPTVLFGTGKKNGVTETAARFGGSARRVTAARLLIGYCFAIVVSVLGVLIQANLYAPYIGSIYGAGYVLRCLLQRALLDASLLSLPFFIAARMKSPVAATAVNVGIALVYFFVNFLGAAIPWVLFIPVPPFLHGLRALWFAEASPLLVILTMLVALAWMAVFGWLSMRKEPKHA